MPTSHPGRVLAIGVPADPVLGRIAPFGPAAAAGTALVVDLDPGSVPYPARRTVAGLLDDGPTITDLAPDRRGVAVIGSGGAGPDDGWPLVERLARGWERVVVRVPAGSRIPPSIGTDLFVRALLPGPLAPPVVRAGVYQALTPGARRPGPGTILLPAVRRGELRRMLDGVIEPRSRWVRAWTPVWDDRWR